MNTRSIKIELTEHIEEYVNSNDTQGIDLGDLHNSIFNEDYYIIGYYNAEKWLKRHNIGVFEGVKFCQEYEEQNFGEFRQYDNAEQLVNMIAYIIGEELIYNNAETYAQ
jgi:hypothetical protein